MSLRDAFPSGMREDARKQAAAEIKRIEDETRATADERARTILATSIQRYAGEYVAERTVAVVPGARPYSHWLIWPRSWICTCSSSRSSRPGSDASE